MIRISTEDLTTIVDGVNESREKFNELFQVVEYDITLVYDDRYKVDLCRHQGHETVEITDVADVVAERRGNV